MATDHFQKHGLTGLALGAVLLAAALYTLNAWLGNLNQDEGWYLYAALEQAAGRLPYRDFFFSQGPFMPRVYGLLAPLWSPQGVAGGRVLTALFGLGGAALAARLAARALPKERRLAGGLTAFLLTAGNVYHSYFTTIPKTYALASLLLLLGVLALSRVEQPKGSWWAGLGGFLLSLAACTRLSLGVALPVAGLYLLVHARRYKGAWFGFGLGGGAGLALLLGPVLATAPDQFLFANFFHATRGAEGVLFAAGSVSRLIRNYLPLVALALAALAMGLYAPPPERRPARSLEIILCLLVFVPIFVVHLISPFPYDDYQVPIMPLLAVAVSVGFWRTLPVGAREGGESRGQFIVVAVLLVWAGLCAGASTLNEEWMIVGKDRFWVIKKARPDLVVLRETARAIAAQVPPDSRLLTQDTYLAVEAKRRVPRGFEMGPFSYFPGMSDEDALRFRILSKNRLKAALLAGDAPVVALSGYGLALEAPVMTPVPEETLAGFLAILERHYRLDRTVKHFGQGHTDLKIWIRQ
jgi:hypothetical protein